MLHIHQACSLVTHGFKNSPSTLHAFGFPQPYLNVGLSSSLRTSDFTHAKMKSCISAWPVQDCEHSALKQRQKLSFAAGMALGEGAVLEDQTLLPEVSGCWPTRSAVGRGELSQFLPSAGCPSPNFWPYCALFSHTWFYLLRCKRSNVITASDIPC